jgi:hypothetical protein
MQHRDIDVLTRAQSLLLFQQVCLSIGRRDALVDVQLYRNVLVTLCRQFISQDGNPLHNHLVPEATNQSWLQWVRSEARRRLVYFTWRKYSRICRTEFANEISERVLSGSVFHASAAAFDT